MTKKRTVEMPPSKSAFTVEEFMGAYGVKRSLLYEEIRAGRIQIRKAGRRTLIRKVDADAWLDALPIADATVAGGNSYKPVNAEVDAGDFARRLQEANAKYNSLAGH